MASWARHRGYNVITYRPMRVIVLLVSFLLVEWLAMRLLAPRLSVPSSERHALDVDAAWRHYATLLKNFARRIEKFEASLLQEAAVLQSSQEFRRRSGIETSESAPAEVEPEVFGTYEEQLPRIEYNEATGAHRRWRDDSRCGPRAPPLPDGSLVECEPTGHVCCSNTGWCGSSLDHCTCSGCHNYMPWCRGRPMSVAQCRTLGTPRPSAGNSTGRIERQSASLYDVHGRPIVRILTSTTLFLMRALYWFACVCVVCGACYTVAQACDRRNYDSAVSPTWRF